MASLPVLLLAIVLGGVPLCAVCAPADPSDAAAMQAIAASVRAPKSLGWGVGSNDPCDGTWVGVQCNEAGRVTSIVASRAGLAGDLNGSDLSKLAFLSSLDLSFNGIGGDLPVLPTPHQHLREVDLGSNKFFGLPDGFFAGLPALETIVLDNNDMEAYLNLSDVLTCSGLRSFSANNAIIIDGFPNYLGNAGAFPALERLSLARNRIFGGIHAGFGGNSKMKYLDVSGQTDPQNKLSGRLDLFIPGMASLVEARLDHNNFFGPLPDATKLVNLRLFDASYNVDLCGERKFAAGTQVDLTGNPNIGNGCSAS